MFVKSCTYLGMNIPEANRKNLEGKAHAEYVYIGLRDLR
jgi:hypothetical protein